MAPSHTPHSVTPSSAPSLPPLPTALQAKYTRLRTLLGEMGYVAVDYTGTRASGVLVVVAHETLGANMLAVLTVSDSLSSRRYEAALALLEAWGIPYVTVHTGEVNDPRYAANSANRCYFCRMHVGDTLLRVAEEYGYMTVLDSYCDDARRDQQPGLLAVQERGLRSPLVEAQFTREDVALLADHLGLSELSPILPGCLANQVAPGLRITPAMLRQIDRAEEALRGLGFDGLRVHHHDDVARIEVLLSDVPHVLERRQRIVRDLQLLGYRYVTLDLQPLAR